MNCQKIGHHARGELIAFVKARSLKSVKRCQVPFLPGTFSARSRRRLCWSRDDPPRGPLDSSRTPKAPLKKGAETSALWFVFGGRGGRSERPRVREVPDASNLANPESPRRPTSLAPFQGDEQDREETSGPAEGGVSGARSPLAKRCCEKVLLRKGAGYLFCWGGRLMALRKARVGVSVN